MGPIAIIKPLPAPWLVLGGKDFFGLSPVRKAGPFLSGQSSFPSLFCLDDHLVTPLEIDKEAPFFSFYLRAVVDALTKVLCLAASISAKGKRRTLDKQA